MYAMGRAGMGVTLGVTLAAVVACSDPGTATREIEPLEGQVKLVAPASGSRFAQNDASIGCQSHAFRGYGFRLAFDWEDVPEAHRYDIYLKKVGALYPAINYHVTESQYDVAWCNAFVIDANLDNWTWRVAAIGAGESAEKPDTLWSEERTYGFEPCRHPDGSPCTAPPEPAP